MSKQAIKRNDILGKNICSTEAYADTFEEIENGKAKRFVYTSQYGKVSHTFIKRSIPAAIGNKIYYDITTPYGYGGPIIMDYSNKELLLREYFEAFHNYCIKNNIVSEFIRFHLFENQDVLNQFNGYKIFIGSHIYRDLTKPIDQDLGSRIVKDVRKAENFGLTIDFDYTGSTQRDFLRVYTETMNRNNATDFYYIDEKFLSKLQKNLNNHFLYANARLNGRVIASRLVFFDSKYGYYYLGGNSEEYYKYKNGTFLDYKLLIELKEKGLAGYVFGGGYRGEDGIYRYKKKFDTKGDTPFYVGGKIHMTDQYDELTRLRKKEGLYNLETNFFPSYRAPRTD